MQADLAEAGLDIGEQDDYRVVVRQQDIAGGEAGVAPVMETYWVPGVNNAGKYGRWAFAEFTEVYQIESDFKAKVESQFNKMIESVAVAQTV